jgi:aspartyl-tRNA(Asn)/glutamyl-tRNA(Gln) amidotransferase subunit C
MISMKSNVISGAVVQKVAKLAKLTITPVQDVTFSKQLSSVIGYVSKIQSLDTNNIPETSQVTGLTNVFREDVIESKRMFTQEEALSNAKNTHNGYFVVPAVFEE